ncbi:MAG: DUF3048 domain-containing protein [Candidatus Uhrbacteria bacterium]
MSEYIQRLQKCMSTVVRECRVHARGAAVIVISALVLIVSGGALWLQLRPPIGEHIVVDDGAADGEDAIVEVTRRSWIDGSPLAVDAFQPNAFAVVVDNAPEAQPQSGIAEATLVFEFPVEGQRTRFIAVFDAASPVSMVGPIRSARPYFVGLAELLEAPLVHVGGSPASLEWLRTREHINQYFDPPFWRGRSRHAPFNVYTAIEDLAEFWVDRHDMVSRDEEWHLWTFAEESDGEHSFSEDRIACPYSRVTSRAIAWQYNEERGEYLRYQGGQVHRDLNGTPIVATNIVLLRVDTQVLDREGRLAMPVLDPDRGDAETNSALVCTSGQCSATTWTLQDPQDGLFGLSVPLQPGVTWVEMLNVDFSSNEGSVVS